MTSSPEINHIATALNGIQVNLKGAKKDSTNPHFKKSYADLSSVWEACKEPLHAKDLSVVQLPGKDEHGHYVETVLLHNSGQWIASKTYTTPVKEDPQAVGSAITYARRYGLAAIVGICPEDDDAEGAQGRGTDQSPQRQTTQKPQQRSNDDDL